jgi:protein SCO1
VQRRVNSERLSQASLARLEIALFRGYKIGVMPPSTPDTEHSDPPPRVVTIRIAATIAAIAILALAALWLAARPNGSSASLIGGPFALQDGAGRTVTDETLRGRPFLVYFGYTHCPDVCPTELARMSDALAAMGDKAIPALFITVDPERDTPKVMQDYVSSFDSHVVGLSGSPQEIGAVEKAYRVFARKGEVQSDGGYSMDHSSIVYLMNKSGGFVEALNLDRPPAETAREVAGLL